MDAGSDLREQLLEKARLLESTAKSLRDLAEGKEQVPTTAYDPDFENFWAAFPRLRRKAKHTASIAWARAVKRIMAATRKTREQAISVIHEAVTEFGLSALGRGRFCQGPSPWLNGSCWEDDREAWKYESFEDMPKRAGKQRELPKFTEEDLQR